MFDIAKTLKELREAAGLTQFDIETKTGILENTYSQYEIGRARPPYEALIKFAELFDVSVGYFLGVEDYGGAKFEKTYEVKYPEFETILDQLSKEDKEFVLDTAKLMLDRARHNQGVRR